MPYTSNEKLPKLRMEAVKLVRSGWTTRAVALHFGYNQSTIVRWVAKAPADGRMNIPTESSRPQVKAGFSFVMMQTDNGPEFQKYFHDMLAARHIALRHSRVRHSNDNAHVERFNRTLQDECVRVVIRYDGT